MNDRLGPIDPEWPEDETAHRLRDILGQEARAITPAPDGLAEIRRKIHAQRRARRAWLRPLAIAAAATATAAVAIVAVVSLRPTASHTTGGALPAASATSAVTTPSLAASGAPAPASASSPPHNVSIYYVGKRKDPQQLLFREIVTRPTPVGNAFIKDAVTALLTTPADDPDYTSYWPAGTQLLGASINGSTAVIDLSNEAASGAQGMGAISAQQLFYTVQGAAPKIDAVELRIAGTPVISLWGTPISDPITADASSMAFSHVWITHPTDHSTVASVVTFGGEASVFEGAVGWEIRMHDNVLRQGTAQATVGAPDRGTWSATVTLTPGTYTIRAFERSAATGAVTYVDDKVITVQ